jgi:hypothetical protein
MEISDEMYKKFVEEHQDDINDDKNKGSEA